MTPERASNANDGNYLVNCKHPDGTLSSGVAYYSNLNPGANVGQLPDDYVDVTHGSHYNWEQVGQGKCLSIRYNNQYLLTKSQSSFPLRRRPCVGPSLVIRRAVHLARAPVQRTTATRIFGRTRTEGTFSMRSIVGLATPSTGPSKGGQLLCHSCSPSFEVPGVRCLVWSSILTLSMTPLSFLPDYDQIQRRSIFLCIHD